MLQTHLRTLLAEQSVGKVAKTLKVARVTVQSWLTTGSSRRCPSPRHLQALLDLVEATPDERANAWALLAQADAEQSGEVRPQVEAEAA